jgi:naphthoate synthase
VKELSRAFDDARDDSSIGVIVLTGKVTDACRRVTIFNLLRIRGAGQISLSWYMDEQGTKAFCSGGDQALRSNDGHVDFENFGRLNVLDLQVCVYRFSMADTSPLCYTRAV